VSVLEQSIASCLGASHVITAASGTTTLHLALVASVIGAGDEVIVPSFSYIATANVVELVGAHPVFVDIETFCIEALPGILLKAAYDFGRSKLLI